MENKRNHQKEAEVILPRDNLEICADCSIHNPAEHKCSDWNCACPFCRADEPAWIKRFKRDFFALNLFNHQPLI